jgi:predicted component of type VI protein secretion system
MPNAPLRWAYISVHLSKDPDNSKLVPSFTESSISKARHRIGRDARCETALENFSVVSSEHCVITTEFELKDQDHVVRAFLADTSTNGTIVDKKVLKKGAQCELKDGSEISMRGRWIVVVLMSYM